MASVLVIDDEVTLRKLMARVIELEGYEVFQAATGKEALKVLSKENIQVVVTDVKLPDGNGVDLTAKIKGEYPSLEIIVLTAFGTIEDGVKAIKNGAFDYLTKADQQEKILPLLSKASEKAVLQQRVESLELRLARQHGFERIAGSSIPLRSAIELARKVAGVDSNVLLLGETGTGKEVFARSIHYESKRKAKSFVALNCSAFPRDLIESELFGHAEGAFTGATKAKKGLVEEAEEGTLFMDEIGEMPLEVQAKVLRLVDAREYYRVGESRVRKANIRLIAATNRNFEKEIEAQRFREDLYYRLSVFKIDLPSLRERQSDIPLLAKQFANEYAVKTNKKELALTTSFIEALQNHSWKGNIRELKNVIERCVILCESNELDVSLLPLDFDQHASVESFELASAERDHIRKVLAHTGGNKTQAAKLLDIGLTTLYQKIKDYNL